MEYRKFGQKYVVRLDPGEEILQQLKQLCCNEGITLAEVAGLGAVNDFTVGIFDAAQKVFLPNTYTQPAEITSLWGTVTTMQGEFYGHLHMSAGFADGHVVGGHLSRGVISLTGELVVTAMEGCVEREYSPEIGLNLFQFM